MENWSPSSKSATAHAGPMPDRTMTVADIDRLAEGWIAYSRECWKRGPTKLPEQLSRFSDRLADLCFDDPELAVQVCARIAELTDDDRVIELLGAGPLENVLERRRDQVLPSFLREAKANPRFRTALRHIWPSGSPDRGHRPRFEAVRERLELPPADPEPLSKKGGPKARPS